MSAPFRIQRPDTGAVRAAGAQGSQENFKFYLDRLMKMIPAEVISLYLIGRGFIPFEQPIVLAAWAVVCLAGVLLVRSYGTADPEANKSPDWVHVAISAAAFVIWIYTLGGPFAAANLYVPYVGSLLVLAWTFFVPIFYKGPVD
jgi:hypothetical protein